MDGSRQFVLGRIGGSKRKPRSSCEVWQHPELSVSRSLERCRENDIVPSGIVRKRRSHLDIGFERNVSDAEDPGSPEACVGFLATRTPVLKSCRGPHGNFRVRQWYIASLGPEPFVIAHAFAD